MKPLLLIGATAAALLAACTSMDHSAPNALASGQPASAAAMSAAMDYVGKAGAADMFEIRSSQIALQKAQNADVRAYAQMMIDHHTKTSADLMAAAQRSGLAAPGPDLPVDKASMIMGLQNAPAESFDMMYMREQVAGHQEALAVHEGYARDGDAAALREVAQTAVPIIRTHLDRAKTLAQRVGA